ncbi:MAG: protein DA1 [Acidobacteria bacterium]|nr:MAG: protein DA1 [Acidobacteriota bacterium]
MKVRRGCPGGRCPGAALILLVALALLPGAVAGRGGLDPERLPADWRTLTVAGTEIHFPPSAASLAEGLARAVPAVRGRVARALGTDPASPVDVILVPRDSDKARQADVPSAPHWAAGFTVPGSGVLYIRTGALGVYPDRDATSIFAHELGHAELGRVAGPARLPRWFEEGTCMVLARPWDLRDSWSLTLAVLFYDPAAVLSHQQGFPRDASAARAAYAQSFAFVEWLAQRRGGTIALGRVARRVGGGQPFATAFSLEFAMTPETAVRAWRISMGRWYRTVSMMTSTTTMWVAMVLLLAVGAVGQRRRRRRILERWALEDGADAADDRPIKPH